MAGHTDENEETVQVIAKVPRSVKEGAKDKLEYGGLSREIREMLERIAFGEEMTQRSRLERRREDLQDKRREKRQERRELDTEIENLDQRIDGINEKLSSITTREDKYDAKIEELEAMLRADGMNLTPKHPAVKRAANTGGVEPEGVIRTLKERNPDVPEHAFEEPLQQDGRLSGYYTGDERWDGLPEEQANLPVDERE